MTDKNNTLDRGANLPGSGSLPETRGRIARYTAHQWRSFSSSSGSMSAPQDGQIGQPDSSSVRMSPQVETSVVDTSSSCAGQRHRMRRFPGRDRLAPQQR